MAIRSGDDRQVCHRLLQHLALARRAILAGITIPPIPWPMTAIRFIAEREPPIAPSLSCPLRAICFIAERKPQRRAVQCRVFQRPAVSRFIVKPSSTPSSRHPFISKPLSIVHSLASHLQAVLHLQESHPPAICCTVRHPSTCPNA